MRWEAPSFSSSPPIAAPGRQNRGSNAFGIEVYSSLLFQLFELAGTQTGLLELLNLIPKQVNPAGFERLIHIGGGKLFFDSAKPVIDGMVLGKQVR